MEINCIYNEDCLTTMQKLGGGILCAHVASIQYEQKGLFAYKC